MNVLARSLWGIPRAAQFWVVLISIVLGALPAAQAQISGTVFRDFNANGTYEAIPASGTYAYGEPTAASVVVSVYNAANTLVTSATTTSTGTYTITTGVTNGSAYRIEFSTMGSGNYSGPLGSNNNSSVQFVTAGAATTAVNFGINYPADYCQTNPDVATSCYVLGNQVTGPNATSVAFVSFPFNAGSRAILTNEGVTGLNGVAGTPYPGAYDVGIHPIMVQANAVGTTLGLAYARTTRKYYTSAFFKWHSDFGPGKAGVPPAYAIYEIDAGSGAVTNTLAIPSASTVSYHNTADYAAGSDLAWQYVGRTSIGGIDLSDDDKTLYALNLDSRRLYAMSPTTGVVSASVAVPTNPPGCPVGDGRPFAVEFHRGTLYVGMVCSAESSTAVTSTSLLQGYVYTVNPTTLAFSGSPVFQFPLNYPRGKAATTGPAKWLPWRSTYANVSTGANTAATANRLVYPQPMLTSIAFDSNNDLIIGIRDRMGDIVGHNTRDNLTNASSATLVTQGRISGDVLRAASTGPTSWTLESNGRSRGLGTAAQGQPIGQGPGGAEFYHGDSYPISSSVTSTTNTYTITTVTPTYTYTIVTGANTASAGQISNNVNGVQGFGANHDEVNLGAVLQIPGQGEVMSLVYDPTPNNDADGFFDGGVRRFSNTTGSFAQAYRLYAGETNSSGDFGKENGLGELIAQCNPAPIEIGQRVWTDANRNGIQEANETSYSLVAGMTVQLLRNSTVVATTTVAADGTYLFSSASTTALQPNTAYQIRLVLPANNYIISPTNATTANAARDSNADPTGVLSLTTGDYGQNDHTYDIGVSGCTQPTGTASATAASCFNNVPQTNARVAVTGITNGSQANISPGTSYTGAAFGDASNVAVSGGAVSFTGLTGGQTYVVRVYSATATCAQDFTVTVSQAVCCSLTFSNVTPGACNSTNNQYVTTGTINFELPVAGNVIVTNGNHTVSVAVTTTTTSVTFALTDESGKGVGTLTATLANCGSISTSYVAPASCFTACASSCPPYLLREYGSGQAPPNETTYTNVGAQLRRGNGAANGDYELSFQRAGTPIQQSQFVWVSGAPNSFTFVYDPAAPDPTNRLTYTLRRGASTVTIAVNPQSLPTGVPPAPVQYNNVDFFVTANSTSSLSLVSKFDNLVINGTPLNVTLTTPVGSTVSQNRTLRVRLDTPNQPLVITGEATFTWAGGTPSGSNMQATVSYGKVVECASPPLTTVNDGVLTCQSSGSAATLTATDANTLVYFSWTGPNNFTANATSVTATTPGTYTILSTNDRTGCTSTTTAAVTRDPGVVVSVFAQSDCLDNDTDAITDDDYFTLTTQATNNTPGPSGRYEVVLGADDNGIGGTVLNPGGTLYGESVMIGDVGQPNAKGFLSNGTSTYTLTVRDLDNRSDNSGCQTTRLTGQQLACSSCLLPSCDTPQLLKQ